MKLPMNENRSEAAIGEGVKKLLTSILSGGGKPGGGGGGGVVTPTLATGAAAAAVVVNSELGYEVGKENAANLGAKLRSWQSGNRDADRSMSPEDVQKQVDAAQGRLDKGSVLGHTADLISSPFSEVGAKDYGQYKADQGLVDSEALKKQIADAVVGGMKAGLAAGGTGVPAANRKDSLGPSEPRR